LIAGLFINNKSATVSPDELSLIKGTLKSKPAIIETSDNQECFSISLNEFPQQKFRFGDPACSFSKTKEFLSNANSGDTVLIEVSNYLQNDKEGTFDAFGLKTQEKVYLNPSDYFSKQTEDQSLFWTFLIIAIILLTIYAVLEFTGMIDRFANWFERSQTSLADYRKTPQIKDFNELDMH
jgi:hypothetical protein